MLLRPGSFGQGSVIEPLVGSNDSEVHLKVPDAALTPDPEVVGSNPRSGTDGNGRRRVGRRTSDMRLMARHTRRKGENSVWRYKRGGEGAVSTEKFRNQVLTEEGGLNAHPKLVLQWSQ